MSLTSDTWLPESHKSLRQFTADRPSANHDQPRGSAVSEKTVSFVRYPASASPEWASTAARAPWR